MLADYRDLAAPPSFDDAAHRQAFRARVHKLGGTAGVLGATAVADLARQTERACADVRGDEAKRLTTELADELARLAGRVAETFATMPRSDPGAALAADAALEQGALPRFAGLLRRHDLSAVQVMRELAPHLRRMLDAPRFEALSDHIDHLRFEAAAEMVEAVAK
jgi:HPt (histidine-containing phosphotransfer) domain-containing protein